jgi:hypothetical protein
MSGVALSSILAIARILINAPIFNNFKKGQLMVVARHSRQKECVDLMCGTGAECLMRIKSCSLDPSAVTYIIVRSKKLTSDNGVDLSPAGFLPTPSVATRFRGYDCHVGMTSLSSR